MPSFYTILTDVGQAKLANAIALGQTIDITELAVGDGNGALPVPETSRTALVNEVRRAPINLSEVDDQNPNWVVVEQVLPPDVGGWTIREIGVFDVDGDLIGYGNYPETYKPVLAEGSSRTQTIRFVMEVSDTQAITLKVDPTVVLATREYADNAISEHASSRSHPSATKAEKGMVELATPEEVKATDNSRAVTAEALKKAGMLGSSVTYIAGIAGGTIREILVEESGLVLIDATNGDVNVSLPASAGNGGVSYDFARVDGSSNAVAVMASGSDTIEGYSMHLIPSGGRRTLKSGDSTNNWYELVPYADNATAQLQQDPSKVLSPATLAAAFQAGNQSLAAAGTGVSGYQVLPGGLIFQWGQVNILSGASAGQDANLPVAFPNAGIYALGGDMGSGSNSVAAQIVGASTVRLFSKDDSGNYAATSAVYWAWGY